VTVGGRVYWVGLVTAAMGCGGTQLAWYGHTPDRSRRVEVHQEGNAQWLALDGRASRRYRFIAVDDLAFAPDGRRLAFAAEVGEHPERWSVVADFVEGRSWDGVAGLRFGPGGRRFAYAALDGHRWQVVVDGVPERSHDEVDPGSVTFSPDGLRLGYVAEDGGCSRAVIDGVSGPCSARVVGLAVADVASRDVTVVADAADGNGAHVLVGSSPSVNLGSARELAVDRAVQHWAVVERALTGWRLVTDGREEETFEEIGRVIWAPDGRTVAYAARRDGAWHVVAGGRMGPPYTEVEEPVFSAHGSRVGYVARDAGRSVVTVDDRIVWESASLATGLTFSADGARVAWVYKDGTTSVIAVDQDRYRFETAVERTLRFSHDGRHWAALVGSLAERRLFLVVDGHTQLPFDTEELFGSPNGDPGERLGAWVSGELELYLAGRGS
jgi:hypothetical protein